MKHSAELQLLIESMHVVLLNKSSTYLEELVENKDLDWGRVKHLVTYHKIRPILYTALKKVQEDNPLVPYLGRIQKAQTLRDLGCRQQIREIKTIFSANDVPILSYKGLLFSEKLYAYQPLRERNDIDIIVLPEHAVSALKLLFSLGYRLVYYPDIELNDIPFLLDNLASSELSLVRNTGQNQGSIDFHWGLIEFPPFGDFTKDLFSSRIQEQEGYFSPDALGIFSMLLNHHGGREFWVRLKHLADLIQYFKTYPEITVARLEERAAQMKMQKVFQHGMALLDENFGRYEVSRAQIDARLIYRIEDMWEKARHWVELIPKAKMFWIKRQILDKEVSWLNMIYYEYLVQTGFDVRIPKPFWFKRIRILNVVSKSIFWFVHKVSVGKKMVKNT